MNNNSKKGAWGREEAANLQFSNLLLTTWWTRGNDIMPGTDGKFFLKLKLLLLFFYWQQINMESSLYYFLRRQIGSSIIWASKRQAIMDNGTQEYPYVFWVNQLIKTLFCHGNSIKFKKKQMTDR